MADTVGVKPHPIQRNTNDVAMELTELYARFFSFSSEEEIKQRFAEFYALADFLRITHPSKFASFVPDEILNEIQK